MLHNAIAYWMSTAIALAGMANQHSGLFVAPPPPSDLGQPGQRSDAGTRGCGTAGLANLSEEHRLTALVPVYEASGAEVVFSMTTSARPTLWFYVPFAAPLDGTFALEDADGSLLYQGTFTSPDQPGIVTMQLPETVESMAVGDRYRWFVVLSCQDDGAFFVVEGWLERQNLNPVTANQINAMSQQEQIGVYASNGFWQDALTVAAEPQTSQWMTLLEEVDLSHLKTEPILNCCESRRLNEAVRTQ